MKRKTTLIILPLALLLIIALAVFGRRESSAFQHDRGFIFGTSYNITYQSDENLKADIMQVLDAVDASLSPFNERSTITAVNQNRDTLLDTYFLEVFAMAREVNAETDGAFDITVAPLVNAWGFGWRHGAMPTATDIDSIKVFTGFSHVTLANGKIRKDDPRTMLDCSAIAKGYGVDQVARLLSAKGIKNYMVEIGGEIATRGRSPQGQPWRIGVTKPTDDSLSTNKEVQTILSVTDTAMATSGNYRNFYYKDGRKYAHTIDPKTGYPVQHNILSATVLAGSSAKADAYATAFMVLGLEKTQAILRRHKELTAYIIYNDKKGQYKTWTNASLQE